MGDVSLSRMIEWKTDQPKPPGRMAEVRPGQSDVFIAR